MIGSGLGQQNALIYDISELGRYIHTVFDELNPVVVSVFMITLRAGTHVTDLDNL